MTDFVFRIGGSYGNVFTNVFVFQKNSPPCKICINNTSGNVAFNISHERNVY